MADIEEWSFPDEIFQKFDVNKDGLLDYKEFFLLCTELFGEDEIKGNEWRIENIFEKFASNEDQQISVSEWERCYADWLQPTVNPVKALLIVDVQNDFIDGSLGLRKFNAEQDALQVIEPINFILKEGRWDKVIYSLDWHPEDHISFYENLCKRELHSNCPIKRSEVKIFDMVVFDKPYVKQILWPTHCIMDTWGAELHKDLLIIPGSEQVRKGQDSNKECYSVFGEKDASGNSILQQMLLKDCVTDLYICGLAFDVCVKNTFLDALKLGYKVAVIEDCCRGVKNEAIEETKKLLLEKGGVLTNSTEVLSWVNEGKRNLSMAHRAAMLLSAA